MLALQRRCADNNIEVQPLDGSQLRALEPRISGIAALRVGASAIVDYRQVSRVLAHQFRSLGGQIWTGVELTAVTESADSLHLVGGHQPLRARIAVACAGLMADRVCDLFGIARDFAIIPFRGEYYQLPAAKSDWVEHLIYPIPDPAMPFLGVHLTPMIDGRLTVGPNALLGWKREGYHQSGNLSLRDSLDTLGFAGFWRLLGSHWRAGAGELLNSYHKPRYLRLVQQYCPGLAMEDLQPCPPGVRAQAVTRAGELVQDFLFAESHRSLHVCNAPSPAATSAFPIAEHIAARAMRKQRALAQGD